MAATKVLGFEGRFAIILYQLVRLLRGGQEVRMSKRTGNFVTLEELVDDVGLDVARFFFLMHGIGVHMDFDLDLAKERSNKNPVYYVQYAHTRIASILREIERRKLPFAPKSKGLTEPQALALVKHLLRFPEIVEDMARSYELQRLPFYAIELADRFHQFYQSCRVIEGKSVHEGRYTLVRAAQTVLANVLHLVGVSAPERM
jgi:arginyl-tRNA synthetase